MASPPHNNPLTTRIHHPKNAKATTEIKEDPELWRDIQANVRKMDDLYDATFYTWLRSEDNVLVTASYLQRLAGEYDLDRIEHALCWLVNGWRLESIAILVKQVTFDWVLAKGDQGELNRARLVLALTDNWAIQYIARLACTLLISAIESSPPAPLLKFSSTHSRMSSMPSSPVASPSLTMTATMFGPEGHPYGLSLASTSRPITPPLSSRSTASSSPSSPSPSLATSPVFSTFAPQPTHGRRMAVSRRLGSPMHTTMHSSTAEEVALQLGRPASAARPLSPALSAGSHRTGHYRQSSSNLQQQRQQDHTQHGVLTTPSHPSFTANSVSATTNIYPPQQQASYHPHNCTVSHHHHPSHQQQQHAHRSLAHAPRSHGSHARQQSQPGTVSSSKQHWLQQQSSYSSSPVFYMNKSLFMEELSRKWSFCRLSEFFQCMDPDAGIKHRFKCKLLKESALKEELSQKQHSSTSVKNASMQQQKLNQEQNSPLEGKDPDGKLTATVDVPLSPMDQTPLEATIINDRVDVSGDVVMTEDDPNHRHQANDGPPSTFAPSSSITRPSMTPTSLVQQTRDICEAISLHPFDSTVETSVAATSARTATVSAPINLVQLQHDQAQYHSLQSFSHGDYNDDMNSGLSRGCKSTDGSHQHCRAQTVEAIMSGGLGTTGSRLSSSSSSSSSSATSPTPTSSASASLSTLTLAESGMEQATRPMSQPQTPYGSNFTTQALYRHVTTLSAAPVSTSTMPSSSTSVAASSSATTLSITANVGQRHTHDSTSTKRKNSLGVSLTSPSHCSSFSSTSSSSASAHSSADASMSSSSAIFPGARRTSTSTSTTNEDLKRLRCSRQNSTSSSSGI
ncbi:hypothetical protein EDD21DRAFT_372580 [Dissophora ornata]|nr:hypothetical protein EDD21DRAFT_372580 [Dissophora ornata]